MPLPTSGPISFSDIQAEFGGTDPISLSEYYAGGAYVPAGTTGTNGAVPSSGAISLFNFYGTSSVVISISDLTVYTLYSGIMPTNARYTLNADGTITNTSTDPIIPTTNWITPTSGAENYEVFATLVSGQPLTAGILNSWLALTANRSWTQSVSTIGAYRETVINLQIRQISTTTILDSANITLIADAI